MLTPKNAQFSIGQIVYHGILQFRGVVVDIDFYFLSCINYHADSPTEHETKPQLWYHMLVDNTSLRIYVPECDLCRSESHSVIKHPAIDYYFSQLKNGIYQSRLLTH